MMSLLLLTMWACKGSDPDDTQVEPVDSSPTVLPIDSDETGVVIPPGEVLVNAAQVVASGGQLWLLAFADELPIEAYLDGVALEGRPSNSYPTAYMFDVPEGHPVGTSILEVASVTTLQVEQRPVEVLAPRFDEVSDEVGLVDVHNTAGSDEPCAQALTGIAWADVDLDGDFDALIGHYGETSRLLLNDGGSPGQLPTFTDVSDTVSFGDVGAVAGLAIADVDGDGDPDVWVGRRGANLLLRNDFVETGAVGFTDITDAWGLGIDNPDAEGQRTMGAVFGDPDQDGDLDFYEINHTLCFPSTAIPFEQHRGSDHLWRNDGQVFTDVSDLLPNEATPVTGRFGFVGMWVDHERDGDQDLFVINDFVAGSGPSVLFRNDKPLTLGFSDIGSASGFAVHPDPVFKGVNGMGIAVGDLNHDGFPDFAVSNIGPNLVVMSKLLANGTRGYENVSEALGTTRTDLPWGAQSTTWATQMFDHDNDGDLELFYVGGNIRGNELVPHAFFDNVDGEFRESTWQFGLAGPGHGKASALVDLDRDGFLDLTVANWGGRLEVYRNTAGDAFPDNHWVMVELEGNGRETHIDAFGSIIELTTSDGTTQTCFRTPRPSLSGGGDPACHFGLGPDNTIASMVVIWPDGHSESVTVPPIDEKTVVRDRR